MIFKFRDFLGRRHNVRAHFWQSCANYSQQASGFLLGILLARLLTPHDFGYYAFISAIIGLSLLPVSWSLAGQIVPEFAKKPEIVIDALHLAGRLIPVRFLTTFIVSATIGYFEGLEAFFIAFILSIPIALSDFVTIPRALLEAQGRFEINFVDSLVMIVFCIFGLGLAYIGAGVWTFVVPAIPLFMTQCFIFRKFSGIHFFPNQKPSGKSYLKSIWSLWFFSVGEQILSRADKFILGKTCSLPDVGDYNRALNYGPVSSRLLNSLVSNPTVAALSNHSDKKSKRNLIFKCSLLLICGGGINFVVLFWFSKDLVPFLFGEQWTNAIPVFEAVAPMSLVLSIANLTIAIAVSKQLYPEIAFGRIGSVAFFLIGSVFFLREMNPVSMAILLQVAILFQVPMLVIAWKLKRLF
jgi:teichuronic acid exporter